MASPEFPMTRWSVVVSAREGDESRARAALSDLCEAYWMPLYPFARRKGKSPEDAEDLTQAFFARLIAKELFSKADATRGKLRSFLLGAFKNFLSDESARSCAQKRGGGKEVISIDAAQAEEWLAIEPLDEESPDRSFQRRWALVVLDRVMKSLRQHYVDSGKGEVFDHLHHYLAPDSGRPGYREASVALGLSENAVRVAVFRMRQRYGQDLQAQIAETVESEEEVAGEIDELFRAVS